jgi:hypothetical protein
MSVYILDGNTWGGSFILEASIDGNTWEPMVAKSSNGTFLGRQGLSTGGGDVLSGYNSNQFSNTQFSVYKPIGSSIPPDTVIPLSIPALMKSTTTTCTVTLSRGDSTWDKTKNIKEDFSVHCVLSTNSPPYWSAPTKFNCVVTDYQDSTGVLTFNATPTFTGPCKFAIIVRSEKGTGMFSAELVTSTSVTVGNQPIYGTPVIDIVIPDDWTKQDTIPNSGTAGGIASMYQDSGYSFNSHAFYYVGSNDFAVNVLGSKRCIHYINNAPLAAPLNGNGYNNSGISLPSASTQTVSIWFWISARTEVALDNFFMVGFWFDGRSDGTGGNWSEQAHQVAPPNNNYMNLSRYYLNGGAAITNFASMKQDTLANISTTWQHVTFVFSTAQYLHRGRVFSDDRPMGGIDVNMGRIMVYSTALSEAQNKQNYDVGF